MDALQGEEFHVFIGHAQALYGVHSLEGGFRSIWSELIRGRLSFYRIQTEGY